VADFFTAWGVQLAGKNYSHPCRQRKIRPNYSNWVAVHAAIQFFYCVLPEKRLK